MYVPCILSGTAVSAWVKAMRTLFGRLKKKTKSGQAAKANTARQLWTLQNFQFLETHLAIRMETRQLGRVPVPVLPVDLEEEEGGDDDASLMCGRSSSQSPSTQRPARLRPAPVNHHVTGGPGHCPAVAVANGLMRPYSSWLIG